VVRSRRNAEAILTIRQKGAPRGRPIDRRPAQDLDRKISCTVRSSKLISSSVEMTPFPLKTSARAALVLTGVSRDNFVHAWLDAARKL
jgi:hypothetical protein